MSIMSSNITSLSTVCSTGCSAKEPSKLGTTGKTVLPGMAIPMLKIRRPNGLVFYEGDPRVTSGFTSQCPCDVESVSISWGLQAVCLSLSKIPQMDILKPILYCMMTSSNGNIFRITGPLCWEFTGLRWIPYTKDSDAELWYFLWSAPE